MLQASALLALTHAPDLTDDQVDALSAEERAVWRQACVRFNLRVTCEHLWANRQPCFTCGAPATWHYAPKSANPASNWSCGACVHRGCSCMATAVYDEAAREGEMLPFDPERDGLRLADGQISPCMEWTAFADPATLPAVEDLEGWAQRERDGKVP